MPETADQRHSGVTDILILVEEAGSANFVAGLPVALARLGLTARIFASRQGYDRLRHYGIEIERPDDNLRPDLMLETIQPRLLLTGLSDDPDSPGIGWVASARTRGIPTVGIVDSRVNLENRFRGRSSDPFAFAPAWLAVPDEWTRRTLGGLGYPMDRIVVTGNPHFDRVRQTRAGLAQQDRAAMRATLYPGATPERRIVLFAAEPATKPHQDLSAVRLAFSGRGQSPLPSYIAIEEHLDAIKTCVKRPYSVLRLHPKSRPEDFSAYLAEFDQVSTGGDPLPLAYAADLIVGSTSMLLIEAAVLGCPTLSLVLAPDETEWLSADMGITAFAHSREELRSSITRLLEATAQAKPSSSQDQTSGRAAERLAAMLYATLSEYSPREFHRPGEESQRVSFV